MTFFVGADNIIVLFWYIYNVKKRYNYIPSRYELYLISYRSKDIVILIHITFT